MAEETRAKRELNECTEQINKMQTYAEKALMAGNESDARTFLEKSNRLSIRRQLFNSHMILLKIMQIKCVRCMTNLLRIFRILSQEELQLKLL